jgi:ribosomal protein S18 acetylase RimI-like enzyme
MTIHLRPARPEDLPAIRDLQIASWRHAYAGLLPESFLQDEVTEVLGARWAHMPEPHWFVETAWAGETLAGFVSVDRKRGPGAYVDNLHVGRAAQGQGAGRQLMAAAARRLDAEGTRRLWLTVMEGNTGARAFYRRIGGQEGALDQTLLYGQPVSIRPVEWLDLAHLGGLAQPA